VNSLGKQKEYNAEDFKNLDLAGARLDGKEFESCTFTRCTFREAALENCKFRACTFRKCDLALVHVKGCAFADTTFEDCQLVGVNWSELAASKSFLRPPVNLTGCALNHSLFTGLTLRGIKLTKCVARDVDFSECDLTRADCTGTEFEGARFWHTNLTEADFTSATHYAISATLNTLKKTKFSLPEAISLLHNLDIILTEL
jgi:fluoroquinolone resistance protein